jgi:hypothetical protein
MKAGVEYATGRGTEAANEPEYRGLATDAHVEFSHPSRLTLDASVRVPSTHLYRIDIQQQLRFLLTSSDFYDQTMELKLNPGPDNLLNDYVYHVQFRATEESMAHAERRPKLIPDA